MAGPVFLLDTAIRPCYNRTSTETTMVQFIATLLAIVALGYSHYLIFRALTCRRVHSTYSSAACLQLDLVLTSHLEPAIMFLLKGSTP
jgi:hypothetical protein